MARVIRENVEALGVCDLITITPPGADALPWDTARCTHPPGVGCSGARGCRIHPDAQAAWHASFRPRLDELMRAARAALSRRGHLVPRYVLVLEPQARGALHVHLATAVADRVAAHELFRQVERLAPNYGFGRRASWDPARGQDRGEERGIGAYISKLTRYVTKEAAGDAGGLRELLDALPGRRVFSVSTKLTASTRATMRTARYRRFLFHRGMSSAGEARAAEIERLYGLIREHDEQREQEAIARRGPPDWVPPWRDPWLLAALDAGLEVASVADAPTWG